MSYIQGKHIIGFVTFIVEGDSLVKFFYEAKRQQIPLWDIKLLSKTKAEMKSYITDVPKLKEIVAQLDYTLTISERNGLFVYFITLWQKKEQLIAILLSLALLFFLANTVWNVTISGVSSPLEKEINEQLKDMGIYRGAMFTSRITLDEVETNLMKAFPELLYINVKKRGTIYTIEAMEKEQPLQKKHPGPSHLVAAKSGMIKKMLVKNGRIVVNVNDFVKKGDLLVSGVIDYSDEQPNDEDEKEEKVQLAAEGEVFANTWYEVTVSSNLFTVNERLEGNYMKRHYLLIDKLTVPLFNFKKIPFEHIEESYNRKQLKLLKKQLPIYYVEKTIYNKEIIEIVRTEDEAKQVAIEHALFDLQQKLGKDSEILKYYILHEAKENGKVKLRLYVSALENIARHVPIQ